MPKKQRYKRGLYERVVGERVYYGGPWYGKKSEAQDYAKRAKKQWGYAMLFPFKYNGKKGWRVLTSTGRKIKK